MAAFQLSSLARACVRDLPNYIGPLVSGPREEKLVRMASNENPLGAGSRARAVLQNAADLVGRYPDAACQTLRQDIAARYGVAAEQVVVGNGSNEILEMAGKAFLEAGRSAVFSRYCFAIYPLMVQATGAGSLIAEDTDYGHDVRKLAAAVRDDTRMLLIANPNNPTATCLGGDDLRWLLQQLSPQVIVVLDQAYGEYVQRHDYAGWQELSQLHSSLLVTRSFSKLHGLAGLRVGCGIGNAALIAQLQKVRQPFNVSVLSQLAASAALADDEHIQRSLQVNSEGMQWLRKSLEELGNLGIQVQAAEANFLTCRTAIKADDLCSRLLRRGVLVRSLAPYQMPDHFRVTVGLEGENRAFIKALKQALEQELHGGN